MREYEAFRDGANLFPTTIAVLASSVAKIARVTRLPPFLKLYRGLGGLMDLPESLFKMDDNGCCGYLEYGFMSTTSNPETAFEYSGSREGRSKPMVVPPPLLPLSHHHHLQYLFACFHSPTSSSVFPEAFFRPYRYRAPSFQAGPYMHAHPPHGRNARCARGRQVLVMEAMSIDRGACILEFSQYPGEVLACTCAYLLPAACVLGARGRVRGRGSRVLAVGWVA